MVPPLSKAFGGEKPKLLDQVRQLLRLRHYSIRTEEAYTAWIRRYILFHGKRHPRELDERDVSAFLSSLAIEGKVAASTQNQALSALLFLYKEILQRELAFIGGVIRVKRPPKLPVVLAPPEVRAILAQLSGTISFDGGIVIRQRTSTPGMSAFARQRCGFSISAHRSAGFQGRERSTDDAPGLGRASVTRASG